MISPGSKRLLKPGTDNAKRVSLLCFWRPDRNGLAVHSHDPKEIGSNKTERPPRERRPFGLVLLRCNAQLTVRVKAEVCVRLPAVAVMVTVEVPEGVTDPEPEPVDFEPPPQPVSVCRASNENITTPNIRSHVCRCLRLHVLGQKSRAKIAPPEPAAAKRWRSRSVTPLSRAALAEVTFVAIVSVVGTALPFGVTLAGLNAQDEYAGSPEQLNVVAVANPFAGVTVIVVVVVLPAMTEADAGLRSTEKSGAGAVMVTVCAADTTNE